MPETRFTQLVGCTVPIQQAPMGPVASADLAVAVAEAGGVGTVAALPMPADQLAARLDEMAARTGGVLSVNFLTEDVDEQCVAAAAERVRLVDFFWLEPRSSLVELVHRAGALVSWQVGSVAEARAAVEAGCDLVIAQGLEAGGHVRGRTPLFPLLAGVLDAVDVPVLAAGGIAHGRILAAALAAGASGARIGTRFIATTESGAHPSYKQAILDAGDGSTVISDAFAVCPLCATQPRARVLRSAVEAVSEAVEDVIGEARMGPMTMPVQRGSGLPPFAGVSGPIEAMALYAGDGVGLVEEIRPAAEVIADLLAYVERTTEATGR